MMRLLVVLASCLVVAYGHRVGIRSRVDAVDVAILRLEKLADEIEDRIHKAKPQVDAEALKARVDALVGHDCSKDEFECAHHTGCVHRLLVCDGTPDCKDGSDESENTCRNPVTAGSSWGGYVMWQSCNVAHGGHVRVLITNSAAQEDLSSELELDATTFYYKGDNSYTSSHATGWYAYGTRTWFVRNTGGHGLGGHMELECVFDSYNDDQCEATITRIGQDAPCGQLRMFRE